jgi:hypothetical protein
MLSLKRHGWLCVLGAEVAYIVCMMYRFFLSGPSVNLHASLFELLPGFSWSVGGMIIGAIDIFVMAWIFGAYMVWMHNTSIKK